MNSKRTCSTLLCGAEAVWFRPRFNLTFVPGRIYADSDRKCQTCFDRNVLRFARKYWTQQPPNNA